MFQKRFGAAVALLASGVLAGCVSSSEKEFSRSVLALDFDRARQLIAEEGVDVDVADPKTGATTLMLASSTAEARIVEFLLEQGADPNRRDLHGQSALFYAAINGRLETARLLLERGAKVDVRNDKGKTARDVAASRGHESFVSLVEAAGDPVAARVETGS